MLVVVAEIKEFYFSFKKKGTCVCASKLYLYFINHFFFISNIHPNAIVNKWNGEFLKLDEIFLKIN